MIKKNKSEYNTEPWNMCLKERLYYFNNMVNNNYKVNIIIYEKADTSTFRYRAYNIYQNLKRSNEWKSIYFFQDEINFIQDEIQKFSMITFVRTRWNEMIDMLITKSKFYGIPVIFDIDDCVCKLSYMQLVTNTLNVDMSTDIACDFWTAYVGRLELVAQKADGFTTTNNFLGNILSKPFGKHYKIIPNFLNDEQIKISEECLKKYKREKNKKFIIGYFSGTPSHINDFKVIYQELICLLEKHTDIQLKVVGFMDFPKDMLRFKQNKQLIFEPLVDFITLQRFIASVDVNIVPLVKNDFTDCKSELKFFEAAIVKTITCASPSYTYKSCIKDGETGFLCQPGMWYEKIRNIYLNKVDINSINNKAYDYVNQFYYGKYITQKIEDAYNFFVNK